MICDGRGGGDDHRQPSQIAPAETSNQAAHPDREGRSGDMLLLLMLLRGCFDGYLVFRHTQSDEQNQSKPPANATAEVTWKAPTLSQSKLTASHTLEHSPQILSTMAFLLCTMKMTSLRVDLGLAFATSAACLAQAGTF